ncbi:MAG: hypothetical protein C4567_04305 [Deltaproteobacteria bacterium]|nr:MAG: hypothetical protein C4567_04305 [Deltaproteobacteria bacterium]
MVFQQPANEGLTGTEIIRYFTGYAIEFNVNIPYASYPFGGQVAKRKALNANLNEFSAKQQFKIIKELCELERFKDNPKVKDIKIKLISRYSQFAGVDAATEINETLIEETRHWLGGYAESLKLFQDALTKFENKLFTRNILDDLRLSLELLLKAVLKNDKSLENQIDGLGRHLKDKGCSKELINMFIKLVEYYSKYQNSYVKHDDAVIEEEIEFIFEITSSFMKHIVKLSS